MLPLFPLDAVFSFFYNLPTKNQILIKKLAARRLEGASVLNTCQAMGRLLPSVGRDSALNRY